LGIGGASCAPVGRIGSHSNETVADKIFRLTVWERHPSLAAVSSRCFLSSISVGLGKLTQPSGVSLALMAGIFIASTFSARGQDRVEEEPLPSSTDYTTAQTDLAPPPTAPTTPLGAFDSKSMMPSSSENVSSAEPRRFHYSLRLTVRGVYDDNIFISHTDRVSDYYFAIEPAITVGFGDIEGRGGNYIRLDYMPSVILFVDHSDEDTVEHLIRLEGQYRFSRLTLNLGQEVAILDGANLNSTLDTTGLLANVDVSARTRLNLYTTRLRANYELTGKLFLTGEFDASIFDYPDFISSEIISGGLYINYNWTPKVVVGIGGTAGYDFVDDPNPDQTFEQVNVRINYQATGKLNLTASGGVEFRQFDGHRGERVTPVFDAGAVYHPFDGTSVTLTAGRRMLNSGFFADQDFATTYVILRIQQRLLQRIYLGLAAGYENADYFPTARGVSATRNDDYYFIEPSVDVLITRFLSTGVYYLHREDSSSFDFFSFYDNQVGVRATLRF